IRSIYYPAKQLQVYTPYYFTSNNVSALDYKTVYGEDAEISASTQLNVMGASAVEKDIAAGNGVVHIINKVLLPPKNVAQEIDANPDFAQYGALFKKRFLTYTYNQAATKAQGNNGDVNGDGVVDSLFIRDYLGNTTIDAENPLNIEKKSISVTAFIPSAAAFQNYMTTRFSEFPNWDDIPINTLSMLYNSHFTNTMDWPTKVLNGQSQSVGGDVINAAGHIMSVKMMSNGLLYQLDKVIEPAAFTTVTGPLYFSKNYNMFLDLLNRSGLIPILTNVNLKYTLLAPPTDQSFIDAGITYNATTNTYSRKKTGGISVNLGVTDIKALVGNHILLNGYSKSELTDGFYPTVNGTYLAVKGGKIEGSVRGTLATIIRSDLQQSNGYFHGLDRAILDPEFSINELILQSLSGAVASPYRKFAELCVAAGLNTKDFLTITNVDAGKKFALFVPTNAKIIAAQNANLLPKTGAQGNEILTFERRARLINYIKFFFIENQVFTDGFAKGKASSTSPTAKPDANGKVPLTVSYPSANVIMVQSGSNPPAGEVNLTNTDNAPQNVIAKDGVIQVIDNAFTSQY
ncbi:MAG: hypothetical protein JWQ25_3323, partial [Daejeonella sp.]|nr:hypothetical protein [Daejeonella sp.]